MLQVLSPGPLSMLQDTGRWGMQALGVGPVGAMDVFAARVANTLLGNAPGAALIEVTAGGARFQVGRDAVFVVSGADLDARLDDNAVEPCAPFHARAGQQLRFGRSRQGWRACLAVRGGFAAEVVFGSASTDLRAGFGGFRGRALARGDCIGLAGPGEPARVPRRVSSTLANPRHAQAAPLGLIVTDAFAGWPRRLREALFDGEFRLAQDSDRMGLRLEPALAGCDALSQQLSSAVCFGALQLPPDGKAIILGADRQTTGGYPLAGVVAGVDHWRIAQARPGERIAFRTLSVQQARREWCEREQALFRLGIAVTSVWQGTV